MSDSYRASLRSSSIIGGSQIFTVLSSIVKMKVAALALGPAGVGLVGLYANLIATAGSISSLGVGPTGVRQVVNSEADGGEYAVGRTRRALFWGSLALAICGGGLFWLCSDLIARVILSDVSRSGDVAWLSIGVALTVLAASQGALLTGLRRVGDLARINIAAGVTGALCGVIALLLWPTHGVIVLVLTAPLFSFLFGRFYIARLGMPAGPRPKFSEIAKEWRAMARPGVVFMLSGVVALLGQLAVRALVQRELGLDALGHFQAAWSISVTYLGFVLVALGTDYFPRLTAVITNRPAAVKLINEQTEVSLLLCTPVIFGMLAFSPWVIQVLYSGEFRPAVEVLRWQLVADILKVISWPLAYMQQAKGAAKTFLATEAFGALFFGVTVLLCLPHLGLAATGVAYLAVYIIYLPLMWWIGRRWLDFRWTRAVAWQGTAILVFAIVIAVACRVSDVLGAAVGGALAVAAAIWALMRLSSLVGADGRLARLAALGEKVRSWATRTR